MQKSPSDQHLWKFNQQALVRHIFSPGSKWMTSKLPTTTAVGRVLVSMGMLTKEDKKKINAIIIALAMALKVQPISKLSADHFLSCFEAKIQPQSQPLYQAHKELILAVLMRFDDIKNIPKLLKTYLTLLSSVDHKGSSSFLKQTPHLKFYILDLIKRNVNDDGTFKGAFRSSGPDIPFPKLSDGCNPTDLILFFENAIKKELLLDTLSSIFDHHAELPESTLSPTDKPEFLSLVADNIAENATLNRKFTTPFLDFLLRVCVTKDPFIKALANQA